MHRFRDHTLDDYRQRRIARAARRHALREVANVIAQSFAIAIIAFPLIWVMVRLIT